MRPGINVFRFTEHAGCELKCSRREFARSCAFVTASAVLAAPIPCASIDYPDAVGIETHGVNRPEPGVWFPAKPMFPDLDFSERRFAESQVLSIIDLTSDQLATWITMGALGPLGHCPDRYSADEIVLLALVAEVRRAGLEFAAALAIAQECESLVRCSMRHFSRQYDESYPVPAEDREGHLAY